VPTSRMSTGQAPNGMASGAQASGAQASGAQASAAQASAAQAAAVQGPAVQGPGVLAPGAAHAPTSAARVPEKTAIPAHMLPHRSPSQLLAIAREGLAEAARTRPDGLRYATAHLAALRAAAAVLAARARPAPQTRRTRITSAWSLLVLVAPEFSEWASYFALGAGKRAAAEAGIPHVVTPREADDLLRAAEQFVDVVESALGLTYQPPLAA
jgi:SAV_6107-like HEPN